jgi:hypothetical protein
MDTESANDQDRIGLIYNGYEVVSLTPTHWVVVPYPWPTRSLTFRPDHKPRFNTKAEAVAYIRALDRPWEDFPASSRCGPNLPE